ncbi:small multi-drug export protein [Arcobacter sp. YIC-464]|uniref:small multi-drug export protein n=1 Tax=Arcobacter sp. YIC-464 TaxID=3376631 RepID=UPI003C1B7A60
MKELLEKLFKAKEGNIFLLGLILIFSLGVFIIVLYFFDPVLASKITGMIFSNLLVGRVPSLSFGYAAELNHFWVILTNVYTETIMVTILYPLFVLSIKGVLKVKVLEEFFLEVESRKKQHKEKFDKYGKFGLFIFVFIPFWMTGPIVGSMIGYLIGMKHYTIISIVFVATVISITLWGVFLQEIVNLLIVFDSQLLWILLFLIVSILLIFRFRKVILDKIQEIFIKGKK